MRKISNYLFMTLCVFILNSCSKDDVNGSNSSYWTLYGETYKATSTLYDSRSELESLTAYTDDSYTSLSIYFGGKPTTAGLYDLTDFFVYESSSPSSKATLGVAAYGSPYFATGRTGDKLKVEILSNNKLKVTFSNIEVKSTGEKATTLSGVLIEQ